MSRPRRPPRVVIDTNLVLSALLFAGGRCAPLRAAWQARRCIPLVSRATAAELLRVLAYPKFRLAADDQAELLADYLPLCETVELPEILPPVPRCRDRFDLPFLHLAVVAKADVLISGDRDLLCLQGQLACPILSADAWLSRLEAAGR
ncbi:putative toxin-antitoxin system toxin component, PIN family [Chiayiivirga flava]|uniref:Putative PIN family toxin of toxin-antitoxin system n=1 Tax=Chiayiivirga flava TaxID=659595 RepID=A0A7W8D6D6_9GAMM|nr:putative toxin-antitoxin system toxin component, PIN family [Chiayiivirga flava]MBB5208738.1 putative PIN family toxin of toxin-antitoxin system [Chiayiivirga flava]